MRNASSKVTSLLNLACKGDKQASEALWPQIYAELRKIAEIHFSRSRRDETVRPTALVNEAFLRLTCGAEINFNDRVHFFATAARAMRYIIADHARSKGREKRGGGAIRVDFDEAIHSPATPSQLDEALSLSDAFNGLEKKNPEWAKVLELKFFGGLTYPEIALVMQISESSVKRKFNAARLWLYNASNQEKR